jgi:hypothetical protein
MHTSIDGHILGSPNNSGSPFSQQPVVEACNLFRQAQPVPWVGQNPRHLDAPRGVGFQHPTHQVCHFRHL